MNAETPHELIAIPKEDALTVFITPKAIDPYLAKIRAVLDGFEPDVTTDKGRKAIASIAYRVSQSKSYLEGVGKALADEQKEIPKKIDATRKRVKETLDAWRDEIRKPLTEWEAAEEARVKKHTDALTVLNELARNAVGRDSAGLREDLAHVAAVIIGPECEEFEAEYARAKTSAHEALTEALEAAITREKEAEELAQLRAEKLKREEAERAEKLRLEAEEALANPTPEPAPVTEEAATVAEAAPAPAAASAPAQPEPPRDPAKEHRASINRAAASAFLKGGLSEEAARQAVILIACGSIPAVTITY